ncbi:MAG: hypothetical protein P0S96_00325 [Simkaniaceae bacterium]|nr:hypothetical protein [Candidatus Sacchlamyda saccharinae]
MISFAKHMKQLIVLLTFCFALSGEDTNTTHRVLQFENDVVKVWKTTIMPHQPLKMHRHDAPRVVVGLKGGSLTKIEQTGETSELRFDSGKAYWLDADPPGTLHGDVNESDEPIEVMVIELRDNED